VPHRGLNVISFQDFDVTMDYAITYVYSEQRYSSVPFEKEKIGERTRSA